MMSELVPHNMRPAAWTWPMLTIAGDAPHSRIMSGTGFEYTEYQELYSLTCDETGNVAAHGRWRCVCGGAAPYADLSSCRS